MPQYDLICDGCEHKFTVEHTMSEQHPKTCPKCCKPKVRTDFTTPPAFHAHYSPMSPRVNRGRGW